MKPLTLRPVTLCPIDRLTPHPENARAHSEEQVSQMARSIGASSFTQPVLVDENYVVLAGHGRLLSARSVRLTDVPAIVIEDLTEQQKRLYLIADNLLILNSAWDEEKLKAAVSELTAESLHFQSNR